MTTTNPMPTKKNGSGRKEIDNATSDVAEQLTALKADFAGLAAAIQNLTGTGAGVVKDHAAAKLTAANEAGELVAHQAMDRATQGAEAIATYTRQKPIVALAAAAGAGLLLGFLTAPRK